MSINRVASRYAKSLIELAIEQGSEAVVLEDIKKFKKALESRDLYLFLKSPIIKTGTKDKIFTGLFEGQFNELSDSFFKIIIRKGREMYLPEIVEQYLEMYKKKNHISTVFITSAQPIGAELLAKLKAVLLDSDHTDQYVELITKIDPTLIGGFVIEIGDKLYDASIQRKLELLRKEFTDNQYVR